MMQKRYNSVYLAPHLDDVVLSCGGQIAQRTRRDERVLIVTVTAGDPPVSNLPPFAQAHHKSWQLDAETVVADRRLEDVTAVQILRADYYHLDLLDAIYRRDGTNGTALYNDDLALFGEIPQAEADLVDRLARQFAALPATDHVIAPLTVGGHIDHRLTRAAAEKVFPVLTYYEDYPYVQWNGLGSSVSADWDCEIVQLSVDDLAIKIAAIAAYQSQIEHLFENIEDMRQRVTAYAKKIGGERLWMQR